MKIINLLYLLYLFKTWFIKNFKFILLQVYV
jgi:hypothetical protein